MPENTNDKTTESTASGAGSGSDSQFLIYKETFEQPTMNLRWADGVLQQEWLKTTVINYVCEKQDAEWRDVPGTPPNAKNEGLTALERNS